MRAALGINVSRAGVDAVLVDADVPEMGPFDTIQMAVGRTPMDVAGTAVEVMTGRARRVGLTLVAAGVTAPPEPDSDATRLDALTDGIRWSCPPGAVVLSRTEPAARYPATARDGIDAATAVALLAAVGTGPKDEYPRTRVGRAAVAAALVVLAVLIAGLLLGWSLWSSASHAGSEADRPPHPPVPAATPDCLKITSGAVRMSPSVTTPASLSDPSGPADDGPVPTWTDPCLRPA